MGRVAPSVCFEVERIIGISVGNGAMRSYQVQWAPTWVHGVHLVGCEHLIEEFLEEQASDRFSNELNNAAKNHLTGGGGLPLDVDIRHHHEEESEGSGIHQVDQVDVFALDDTSDVTMCDLNAQRQSTATATTTTNGTGGGGGRDNVLGEENVSLQNNSQILPSSTVSPVVVEGATCGAAEDQLNQTKKGGGGSRGDSLSNSGMNTFPAAIGNVVEGNLDGMQKGMEVIQQQQQQHQQHQQNDSSGSVFVKTEHEETGFTEIIDGQSFDGSLVQDRVTFSQPNRTNFTERSLPLKKVFGEPPSFSNFPSLSPEINNKYRAMETMAKKKPYKCNHCKKTFCQESKLYRHTCPVCSFCGKAFVDNRDLERHLRSHTGERPFKCGMCPRDFKHKFMLKKHVNEAHNLEPGGVM